MRKKPEGLQFWNGGIRKIVSEPIRLKDINSGALTSFRTKNNIPVVTFHRKVIFGDPNVSGEYLVFFPEFHSATFIDAPIPATVIEKNIRGHILTKRVFIPYSGPIKDTSVIFKEKIDWNPFVERLNSDKRLLYLIKCLPTEYTVTNQPRISLVMDRSFSFEMIDAKNTQETVCQIIPFQSRTFVVLKFITGNILFESYIYKIVELFQKIRDHIMDFGYQQPTEGKVAQAWPPFLNEALAGLISKSNESVDAKVKK